MAQRPGNMVRNFRGENRLLPDDLLPDTVSPDAQNCDYSRATIRKRDGYSKLHPDPILPGGVWIQNATSARCIKIPQISAYAFSGNFTLEMFVTLLNPIPASGIFLLTCRNTVTKKGFSIQADAVEFFSSVYDGATIRFPLKTDAMQTGKRYHLSLTRSGNTAYFSVDAVAGSTVALSNSVAIDRDIFVGCAEGDTPQNQTSSFVVDEIRMWSAARSSAELLATHYRELNRSEIASTTLVGYWRLNEAKGSIVLDESTNLNHGSFYISGPIAVPGIIPEESGEGAALRFDGIDDTATAAYTSQWAAVMDTGTAWTVEAWVRLDSPNHASAATVFHLGSTASTGAGQQGPVFQLRFATTTNALQVLYATSTTATVTITVGYTAAPGVPFHIAIIRTGTTNITVYINGVLYATSTTGLAASTGPITTPSSYGFYLGAQNNAGTFSVWAPVTIDDVRLWKSTRSSQDIINHMYREYADATDLNHGNLVAYWRMNSTQLSGSISIPDETGLFNASNATTPMVCSGNTLFSGTTNIRRAQGLVYPNDEPVFQLVAPLVRRGLESSNTSTSPVFDREILVATRNGFHSIAGPDSKPLNSFDFSTGDAIYDYCYFKDFIILTNGANKNYKYDGTGVPHALSLVAPGTFAAASNGSGGGFTAGVVQYKIAFRNSRDGTESVGSATISVTTVASDKVNLSSLPTYTPLHGGVDQLAVYRTAVNGSVFYLVGYIYNNTVTTATDTSTVLTPAAGGGAATTYTLTSNALYDAYNGDAPVCRYCCSHLDRVFVANSAALPSGVYWTETNSHYKFTATNVIQVNPGDGDEVTGLCSAFGGLLIFKRFSIWYLSGTGNTTFELRPLVQGRGCVAGQTIKASPYGVYFMAMDGVYRIDSGFAINPVSGFSTDPTSFSQQSLFKQLNTKRAKYSTAVYDAITHQYLLSADFGLDVNTALPWHWNIPLTDGTGAYVINSGTVGGVASATNLTWVTDTTRGVCASYAGNGDTQGPTYTLRSADDFASMALGGWFYVTALSQAQALLAIADVSFGTCDHDIYVNTNGSISYRAYQTGLTYYTVTTAAATVSAATWFHVFATYQNNVMSIYINGSLVASTRQSYGPTGLTGAFYPSVSYAFSNAGNQLTGRAQNIVAVANTPVLSSDIRYLYRSQLPGTDLIQQRLTLAYYEEHDAWAKWDKGFDYLSGGSSRSSQYIILAGKNGFVYQLKSGLNDGAGREGSSLKLTGTITSGGTTTIVDSAAAFPVTSTGQGALQGCYVVAAASATAPDQTRLIVDNTATTLYLDSTFAPTAAGAYVIAGIDWYWISRYMDMGDPANIKRWYWMQVWEKNIAAGNTVTFEHRTDDYATWQSTTFSTAYQLREFLMQNRGHKIQIKFSNANPGQEVDIEAFQMTASPRRFD